MGVYYNAYAVFGLKIPKDELPVDEGEDWYKWLEDNVPAPYTFERGGSYYDDTPISVVIAKPKHIVKLFSYEDYGHDKGGVQKLSDFVSVSRQDAEDMFELANYFNMPYQNIDFWLVSLWS